MPVGQQPEDIATRIAELVYNETKDDNSIILAVSQATTDIANSDSLSMAKRVDPRLDRTIAVITKLDLMDKGTDARKILRGEIFPVKNGIIGVVNRSQLDLQLNKSLEKARRDEEIFFKTHYPYLGNRCGTTYLGMVLNKHLMHHIQNFLPVLKVCFFAKLKNFTCILP